MRRQLTFTIIGDGGTDRALVPIVTWAIHFIDPEVEVLEPEFRKRIGGVEEFLSTYRAETMLLFMHRDAETDSLEVRLAEFDRVQRPEVVPLVTVRMTEAWLLIDPSAIATAAGKPEAKVTIPPLRDLESLSNPKALLEGLLTTAADVTGRRRKSFEAGLVDRRIDVARRITDYSPLLGLSAFSTFVDLLKARYPYGPRD